MNFKAYLEATGKKSIELAKVVDSVSREKGLAMAVAPQFTDLKPVAESVQIPVFSQHVDPVRPGPHTGHVLPEAVRSAGAAGTLVNHSERRIRISEIEESIDLARGAGLLTLVCANTSGVGAAAAALGPDIIAVEPPELIGTGVAVSKARPEVVTNSVNRIRAVNSAIKILCGAGVSTSEDVSKAVKLGTEGVLVSSSVVKSKDPRRLLLEMADAALNST